MYHNAKHSRVDAGAVGISDKLRVLAAPKGAVTIMHKHVWSVGEAAAKNR